MDTSIWLLTTTEDSKKSEEHPRSLKTPVDQEYRSSPDTEAMVILRKRRLRRGRAIAATAVSCASARIIAS